MAQSIVLSKNHDNRQAGGTINFPVPGLKRLNAVAAVDGQISTTDKMDGRLNREMSFVDAKNSLTYLIAAPSMREGKTCDVVSSKRVVVRQPQEIEDEEVIYTFES